LQKILLTAATAAGLASAQEVEFTHGYNAVQIGETDGNLRMRSYTNIGIQNDAVRLSYHGLNEVGNDYAFGRENFKLGYAKLPVDLLYSTRFAGTPSSVNIVDGGIGARVNISNKHFYGFVDGLKHLGIGSSKYAGPELIGFVGKGVHGWNLES